MPFDHVNMEDLPELVENTTEFGRTYVTPEGNRYPSITTVLKVLSDEGIEEWKKRVGEDEARRVLIQAGRRGTAVHDLAEKYLNNEPNWKKGAMPSNLHSFMQLKPILDERVNNVWAQEVPLYSDRLKIAGRVDLIAEYRGELAIIDFKTARKKKKTEWIQNYFMQTAFYAAAFFERTGIPIKKGVILITPDGSEPQVFETSTHDYLPKLIETRKEYRRQFDI
jgi:hypothetical protein